MLILLTLSRFFLPNTSNLHCVAVSMCSKFNWEQRTIWWCALLFAFLSSAQNAGHMFTDLRVCPFSTSSRYQRRREPRICAVRLKFAREFFCCKICACVSDRPAKRVMLWILPACRKLFWAREKFLFFLECVLREVSQFQAAHVLFCAGSTQKNAVHLRREFYTEVMQHVPTYWYLSLLPAINLWELCDRSCSLSTMHFGCITLCTR